MDAIKSIMGDISIAALETGIGIASIGVVSDAGNVIYQSENWDLTKAAGVWLQVRNGAPEFDLNGVIFSVTESSTNGMIGTSNSGMGHVIFAPLPGGMLVSYVMPQANPSEALEFLKPYAEKLKGKI